jgi:hypothetical protein
MKISLIILLIITLSKNTVSAQDSLSITGTVYVHNSYDITPAEFSIKSDSGHQTKTDILGKFRLYLPDNYKGNIKISGIGIGDMIIKDVEITKSVIIERIPVFEYSMHFGEWGYYEKKMFFGLIKKRTPYATETQIVEKVPDGTVIIRCLDDEFEVTKQGGTSQVEFNELCKKIVMDTHQNTSHE